MEGVRPRWATPRRLALLGGLVALAVIAGILLGLGSTRGFQKGYALPDAGSELPATPVGPLPPPVGTLAPRVVAPAVVAPAPVEDVSSTVDDEDAQRIAEAVTHATERALRRGEPVRWHKAGQSGYVTVSEEQVDGDRRCRNVSATIDSEGGPAPARSHLWCDDGDGDWAPQ